MRVEDKLIGPLSLRQIIIIAIGGGTSYVLLTMVKESMGTVPTAAHLFIWIPAIIMTAFAIVRVNDIPLTRYFLLILEGMSKPKIRVWRPRKGVSTLAMRVGTTKKKKKKKGEEEIVENEKGSDVRLEELSVLLDQEGQSASQREVQLSDASEQTAESIHSSTH